MVYIVDTHSLIWYLEESEQLGSEALRIFDDGVSKLVIPTIVLAEVKYLSLRKRIALPLNEVFDTIRSDIRCLLYPLDSNVVEKMPPGLDIHDGIICGTALVYRDFLGEEVKIITRDEAISSARIIETVW